MKKILFLLDTLETGGAEKSLLEISKRFKKYEPVFIHLFPGTSLKNQFADAGVEVKSMNFPVTYDFKKIARQLIPVVKEINPAVIHSTLFRSDMVTRHLKRDVGIPIVNSFVNNSYSKRRYKELSVIAKIKLFILQNWDRITSKNVDLFISNSEAIKITNTKALKIHPELIKVIYRGRDPQIFKNVSNEEINSIKEEFPTGKGKVFLNVSRLLHRKGQSDLLKAFKEVSSLYPDSRLLIAGEGPYRQLLQSQINDMGMKDIVFLLGNRGDVPALLKIAHFFVFPSHYEGLPGALIEATLSKKKIIASNIPENLECVQENSVLLFKVGDVDDLKKQMLKVLKEENCQLDLERGYDFAIQNFSIENVVTQYEKTYDELLKNLD